MAATALALTGCISPVADSHGQYATPIGNAPVTNNDTPYTAALYCLRQIVVSGHRQPPRIAIGNIRDYTYKDDFEGGRKVTQGASLMAMSAFAKAGARLVERFDTSVTELELKYTNNKLVSDEDVDYRRIMADSIQGSDYYLVGGITELNYNIRSGGIDGFYNDTDPTGLKATAAFNQYVLNIGLDLRLVNSRSLEVVDVISYQKQIIGREISAGVFSFLGGANILDIGVGERALEPIQLAVRSVIERATIEMLSELYGVNPQACNPNFGTGEDPLGEITPAGPEHTNLRTADALQVIENEPIRYTPYAWYQGQDGNIDAYLRGSMN